MDWEYGIYYKNEADTACQNRRRDKNINELFFSAIYHLQAVTKESDSGMFCGRAYYELASLLVSENIERLGQLSQEQLISHLQKNDGPCLLSFGLVKSAEFQRAYQAVDKCAVPIILLKQVGIQYFRKSDRVNSAEERQAAQYLEREIPIQKRNEKVHLISVQEEQKRKAALNAKVRIREEERKNQYDIEHPDLPGLRETAKRQEQYLQTQRRLYYLSRIGTGYGSTLSFDQQAHAQLGPEKEDQQKFDNQTEEQLKRIIVKQQEESSRLQSRQITGAKIQADVYVDGREFSDFIIGDD